MNAKIWNIWNLFLRIFVALVIFCRGWTLIVLVKVLFFSGNSFLVCKTYVASVGLPYVKGVTTSRLGNITCCIVDLRRCCSTAREVLGDFFFCCAFFSTLSQKKVHELGYFICSLNVTCRQLFEDSRWAYVSGHHIWGHSLIHSWWNYGQNILIIWVAHRSLLCNNTRRCSSFHK